MADEMGPTDFGMELSDIVQEAETEGMTSEEFQEDVEGLIERAREDGLPEEQIGTQLGAKADVMERDLL